MPDEVDLADDESAGASTGLDCPAEDLFDAYKYSTYIPPSGPSQSICGAVGLRRINLNRRTERPMGAGNSWQFPHVVLCLSNNPTTVASADAHDSFDIWSIFEGVASSSGEILGYGTWPDTSLFNEYTYLLASTFRDVEMDEEPEMTMSYLSVEELAEMNVTTRREVLEHALQLRTGPPRQKHASGRYRARARAHDPFLLAAQHIVVGTRYPHQ
ncbi:hypothetical protein EXIGLDRAFT_691747 [Exidia glandulosa HHB12029]|uniref:Uncharacterized protein n=1 Tax=Exidia glandulosa HHB12029 TaxID=1314781 RepID=A0A165P6R8_EXIGL|nr:hypothetical protein EXIGLDRAFT_691747 [Exidia glandulosa HHB12029]